MSRSSRVSALRGASGSRRQERSGSQKKLKRQAEEGAPAGGQIEGRHIPVTPGMSLSNVVAGFYNALPAELRNNLPFGVDGGGGGGGDGTGGADDGPPKDKRGEASWQDVCFIHSIPGEDEEEGLVVLGDGSMRKYMTLKGINVLLFDDADRDQMARGFANMVNSCESDVQIIIKSRHLSVDEYLSRYQVHIKSDNEYLK